MAVKTHEIKPIFPVRVDSNSTEQETRVCILVLPCNQPALSNQHQHHPRQQQTRTPVRLESYLIPPHVVVADVPVSAAEEVQRSVVEHRGVERPGGGAGIAPLHYQTPPARGLAVVHVKVRETAELSGEASPEVDVTANRIKATAVGHSRLGKIPLFHGTRSGKGTDGRLQCF